MAKQAIEIEGTVIEVLPNATFRVRLENGHEIHTYLSGKMRQHYIRVLEGDRVKCEMLAGRLLAPRSTRTSAFGAPPNSTQPRRDLDVGLSWSIAPLSAECWSFLPPDSHEGEWQGAGSYLDGKRTAALRVSPGSLEGELARDPVTELGAAEGGAADHVCFENEFHEVSVVSPQLNALANPRTPDRPAALNLVDHNELQAARDRPVSLIQRIPHGHGPSGTRPVAVHGAIVLRRRDLGSVAARDRKQ